MMLQTFVNNLASSEIQEGEHLSGTSHKSLTLNQIWCQCSSASRRVLRRVGRQGRQIPKMMIESRSNASVTMVLVGFPARQTGLNNTSWWAILS